MSKGKKDLLDLLVGMTGANQGITGYTPRPTPRTPLAGHATARRYGPGTTVPRTSTLGGWPPLCALA